MALRPDFCRRQFLGEIFVELFHNRRILESLLESIL
jgi:hypothetical protein